MFCFCFEGKMKWTLELYLKLFGEEYLTALKCSIRRPFEILGQTKPESIKLLERLLPLGQFVSCGTFIISPSRRILKVLPPDEIFQSASSGHFGKRSCRAVGSAVLQQTLRGPNSGSGQASKNMRSNNFPQRVLLAGSNFALQKMLKITDLDLQLIER